MWNYLLLILTWNAVDSSATRHAFFRKLEDGSGGGQETVGRRVYGGSAAALAEFPAACALLDRYWGPRCSATVLAPYWALTAAHCVTRRLAYVKYNTRRPNSPEGDVTPVQYLYRHPKYEVRETDEGQGLDVTVLHNDVGLVRTRNEMRLSAAPAMDVLSGMSLYSPSEMYNKEVTVLGFGRSERSALGEELFSVQLTATSCERTGWEPCICGLAPSVARAVCSGDSGGPVLYQGVQVGVTSMGPVECSTARPPPVGATSVFTWLQPSAALLNATLTGADAALRMSIISRAPPSRSTFISHMLLLIFIVFGIL
ncbi:chymotrypsin-1-like [Pieris rapae]|uniref:chymotrypsin-1-like n=1 Tax=Pieris rapae TaxID=64459 RepID=UPI001E280245|nr:chymotrypsin-1-like [Pieris rapae]